MGGVFVRKQRPVWSRDLPNLLLYSPEPSHSVILSPNLFLYSLLPSQFVILFSHFVTLFSQFVILLCINSLCTSNFHLL